MAYQNQNQSSAYVPAIHQLFYLASVHLNQSEWWSSFASHTDLCSLKIFRATPKCEFWLYSDNVFLHFENEINTGIYEWE